MRVDRRLMIEKQSGAGNIRLADKLPGFFGSRNFFLRERNIRERYNNRRAQTADRYKNDGQYTAAGDQGERAYHDGKQERIPSIF